MRNGSRVIILSSVFHGAVSKTSNVLDIFLMQLKLSICHPLTPSVTLAHSGGGDGDRGDGDGMMGCPATSKSTGNHCGETVLGFGEIKLVTIMTGLACLVHRSCDGAVPWLCGSTQNTAGRCVGRVGIHEWQHRNHRRNCSPQPHTVAKLQPVAVVKGE